jgi:hypothetical protein
MGMWAFQSAIYDLISFSKSASVAALVCFGTISTLSIASVKSMMTVMTTTLMMHLG